MRNVIVRRLTMYDTIRGEPTRLTVRDWQEAEQTMQIDPQHVRNINDPLEKPLVDTYKLAY